MGSSKSEITNRNELQKALSLNLEQSHIESKLTGDVTTAEKIK